MNHQLARACRKEVEGQGLVLVHCEQRKGGHIGFVARNQAGAERKFFMPLSPSDHRGALNRQSLLRRFAREAGVGQPA